MNFDDLIECTRCGSDACYKQEINQEITLEMCLGCGFQHNSIMVSGSQFLQEQMETLPELYKALLDEEEESSKIWMPTTINIQDKGMIFAEGTSRDNWAWAAVKSTLNEEKEYKTDMSTAKHFPERDFIGALSHIGILPE